jgi:hypothetical protein
MRCWLGTALAPAFVAIFVGLGLWWGLPVLSAVLLTGLLMVSVRLPLRSGAREAGERAGTGAAMHNRRSTGFQAILKRRAGPWFIRGYRFAP